MKQKAMAGILAAEAAACVLFGILRMNFSGGFTSLAAFPFEQAGYVLRKLSLSGALGNAAAIVLYTLLSLIPCFVWLVLRKKGRLSGIDHELFALSLLLFAVNYYMVNPGLFASNIPGAGKWMLGCTFYSALTGYLVTRILLVCRNAEPDRLQSVLQSLLYFLNMVFVYLIFGQGLGSLPEAFQSIRSGSAGLDAGRLLTGTAGLGLTYLFLGFGCLTRILPYIFDMGIVFLAERLLASLGEDRYSDESVRLADRLAGFCAKALEATVALDVVFNVLQVFFRRRLYQMDLAVHVPVLSIIFVLAVLLFARFIHEDQKLKQDHDLII